MKSVQVIQPAVGPGLRPTPQLTAPSPLSLAVASDSYTPPMVVSTFGKEGSGKSRLGGSMPGDIGALFFEHKSKRSVLNAAKEFGRRVIVPTDEHGREISFIRVDNPMLLSLMPDVCVSLTSEEEEKARLQKYNPWPAIQEKLQKIADGIRLDGSQPTCCKRHYYRYGVNRAKWALWKMAESPNIKSIIVDTFGQLVQDISYANYGKDGVIDPKEFGFAPRQDMNQEVRDLLNSISHKHMLLTHQSAAVWKDGKPVPGRTKASSSFSGLGHYTTVQLEQFRIDGLPNQPDGSPAEGRYRFRVLDCQENASIIGRDDLAWDDAISFGNLALAVYGPDGYDPDEFE